MKKQGFLFICLFMFAFSVSAQNTGSKQRQDPFEEYKRRQMENQQKYEKKFTDYKEKRKKELEALKNDYTDYVQGLGRLHSQLKDEGDEEAAEHVKEIMEYEDAILNASVEDTKELRKEISELSFESLPSEEYAEESIPEFKKKRIREKDDDTKAEEGAEEAVEKENDIDSEASTTVLKAEKGDKYVPSLTPLPASKAVITSPFGVRMHPVLKREMKHNGVDFGSGMNAKIYAAANGTVTVAQYSKSFGNFVVIRHEDGYSTTYAHLEKMSVTPGETVKQGEVIGYSGNTGRSTGSHLHYEVRLNGVPLNPESYLAAIKE